MELHKLEAQGSVATDFLRTRVHYLLPWCQVGRDRSDLAPVSFREVLDFASRSNDMPMRHDQVNAGELCQIISA
jgi:hypothetical protein